jgi:hypothetical protein
VNLRLLADEQASAAVESRVREAELSSEVEQLRSESLSLSMGVGSEGHSQSEVQVRVVGSDETVVGHLQRQLGEGGSAGAGAGALELQGDSIAVAKGDAGAGAGAGTEAAIVKALTQQRERLKKHSTVLEEQR